MADVSVYEYENPEYLYLISEAYLSLNKQEIIVEIANLLNDSKNEKQSYSSNKPKANIPKQSVFHLLQKRKNNNPLT